MIWEDPMEREDTMLEYCGVTPRRVVEVRLNLGRAIALGYVALCVLGLVLMGTVMAFGV